MMRRAIHPTLSHNIYRARRICDRLVTYTTERTDERLVVGYYGDAAFPLLYKGPTGELPSLKEMETLIVARKKLEDIDFSCQAVICGGALIYFLQQKMPLLSFWQIWLLVVASVTFTKSGFWLIDKLRQKIQRRRSKEKYPDLAPLL